MSDFSDKNKRSKRLQEDENHIRKQMKIAKQHNVQGMNWVKHPHSAAKHHVMNCGRPNCVMCGNPRKFFNEETMQERSHKQEDFWDDDQTDKF